MSRFSQLKQSTGQLPGTLVHVGEQKTEQVKISLMAYEKGSKGALVEQEISSISELASLYGMNFRYMPELEWRWGYAAFWLVLLLISGLQLLYFRKKGGL